MQAREIEASMDNKLYLCDEELGSSRLCVLCGKPCLGVGAALGGKDARWRLHPWQGSAELVLVEPRTKSEDKDTPRLPQMLIANSTPTITIGYSYIWQNEGDMHSIDRSNRICQEFVYGSIGPSIGITASQQTPNVCQNLCKTCMSTFNLLATQYWLYPECWTSKS